MAPALRVGQKASHEQADAQHHVKRIEPAEDGPGLGPVDVGDAERHAEEADKGAERGADSLGVEALCEAGQGVRAEHETGPPGAVRASKVSSRRRLTAEPRFLTPKPPLSTNHMQRTATCIEQSPWRRASLPKVSSGQGWAHLKCPAWWRRRGSNPRYGF